MNLFVEYFCWLILLVDDCMLVTQFFIYLVLDSPKKYSIYYFCFVTFCFNPSLAKFDSSIFCLDSLSSGKQHLLQVEFIDSLLNLPPTAKCTLKYTP